MPPTERDHAILKHIVDYCDQIQSTVTRFGNDYDIFRNDSVYRNATALCILQIGELTGKLSEAFRASHDEMPWKQIKAMRNIVAHNYGSVDPEITWEIITDDILRLKQYCMQIVG